MFVLYEDVIKVHHLEHATIITKITPNSKFTYIYVSRAMWILLLFLKNVYFFLICNLHSTFKITFFFIHPILVLKV